MADSIDPYRQWLAIDDPERPPNHYLLLGLELFENDGEKTWTAAMQRMALVLEHDPGPHCELARQLFDELEMARNCLADPHRKQKYDESLRQHLKNVEDRALLHGNGLGPVATCHRGEIHSGQADALGEPEGSDRSSQRRVAFRSHSGGWQSPSAAGMAAAAVIMALLSIALATAWNRWEPAEHDPVEALLVQLSSSDSAERLKAAEALRALGPRAYQAIPALLERLRQERDDRVRLAAAEALAACGASLNASAAEIDAILAVEIDPAVRVILEPWANGDTDH